MLHNGAGSSRGQSGSSRAHSDHHPHHRDESLTSKSSSDKYSKQCPQFRLQRPSVLRKGSQALPQSSLLLNHSALGDCATETEFEKNLPDNALSYSTSHPGSPDEVSGTSLKHSTPEQHTEPSQVALEALLFVKGMCKWPGCKEMFKEFSQFLKHLHSEHPPGEQTIDEWKLQRDMVQHMENQLTVEKQRLQAMKLHLFAIKSCAESSPSLKQSSSSTGSLEPSQGMVNIHGNNRVQAEMLLPGYWQIPNSHFIPGIVPSIECYKFTNIRPPFTYAAMIRWAILESPEKQLTLNDIYRWFTRMFSYFRHNTATWKNAVRHNLSLHKCFVRVDGGKGSVWTVDEAEFLRRKGQKFHRDQDMGWMAHYSTVYSRNVILQ